MFRVVDGLKWRMKMVIKEDQIKDFIDFARKVGTAKSLDEILSTLEVEESRNESFKEDD